MGNLDGGLLGCSAAWEIHDLRLGPASIWSGVDKSGRCDASGEKLNLRRAFKRGLKAG
jgi:hypothetical protein